MKRSYAYIIVICIVITFVGVIFFVSKLGTEPEGKHEYALGSDLVMKNPRGDIVSTYAVWLKEKDDHFHIHTLQSPEVTQQRLHVINDVLFSDKIYSSDTSGYFGWGRVLSGLSNAKTHFPIPYNLHPHVTSIGEGDIMISLTKERNENGYAGFTKLLVDEEHHQILKAEITIYDVDRLTADNLALILRHELGHGLGLGHSDSSTDLMYHVLPKTEPYISQCDINALFKLYNDSKTIAVMCD